MGRGPRCCIGQTIKTHLHESGTALEGPEGASRMILFRLYYLGLAPYGWSRHFLGLSERGWTNWSEELLRGEMFPPRKYFRNGE